MIKETSAVALRVIGQVYSIPFKEEEEEEDAEYISQAEGARFNFIGVT